MYYVSLIWPFILFDFFVQQTWTTYQMLSEEFKSDVLFSTNFTFKQYNLNPQFLFTLKNNSTFNNINIKCIELPIIQFHVRIYRHYLLNVRHMKRFFSLQWTNMCAIENILFDTLHCLSLCNVFLCFILNFPNFNEMQSELIGLHF